MLFYTEADFYYVGVMTSATVIISVQFLYADAHLHVL